MVPATDMMTCVNVIIELNHRAGNNNTSSWQQIDLLLFNRLTVTNGQISIWNAAGDAPTCPGIFVIILHLDMSLNYFMPYILSFFFQSSNLWQLLWVSPQNKLNWLVERSLQRPVFMLQISLQECFCRGMNWDSGTSGLPEVRPTGIQKFSLGPGLVLGFDPAGQFHTQTSGFPVKLLFLKGLCVFTCTLSWTFMPKFFLYLFTLYLRAIIFVID